MNYKNGPLESFISIGVSERSMKRSLSSKSASLHDVSLLTFANSILNKY